jgi:hypothetical protein
MLKNIKTTRIAVSLALSISLSLLTGCASHPAKSENQAKTAAPEPAAAKAATPDGNELLKQTAAMPSMPWEGEGWKPMFDGKTLAGWRVTDFAGHGAARCEQGLMVLDMGAILSGVNWTNELPKTDYEVALDAMRLEGSDFFCALTVPVGESFCSLIVGGWGGTVVGISSIDGLDASENETTQFIKFDANHWYRVRLRVTPEKIQAWLDEKKVIDVAIKGRKITLRYGEIELSKPFGIATYQTSAALREIKMRRLDSAAEAKKP